MANEQNPPSLQSIIWNGSVPLDIRLASAECRTFDQSDPYLIQCPRLSYLPFLLPRLHAFFTPAYLIRPDAPAHSGWFSFEGVPLKWHFPVGLLYDLFSGAEPHGSEAVAVAGGGVDGKRMEAWKLTVHFSDWPVQLVGLDAQGRVLHDAFINSVKEADFLRNGTAKAVMSLSKNDSVQLWKAVENHDRHSFNAINNKLLNHPGSTLRHCPIKIYLPTAAQAEDGAEEDFHGSLRIIQAPVAPFTSSNHPQTIGTALNALIPSIFPSRRNPVLAQAVLHGAVLPMNAVLSDLIRDVAYADGFLHVGIVMLS